MRLFGRGLLVLVVVCLLPVRSEAALMDVTPTALGDPLDPGIYNLAGSFTNDNDIALYAFTLSATRYYQLLNELIENPAALEHDPILVKRLKRLRLYRQRQRVARLLGAEYAPNKR